MKIWIKVGVIIFYVLIYYFLKKFMRRDFIKFFKAMMLLLIFILSLLPEEIIIKQLGLAFRADTLILWMAGIEAVDAWDEYEREKNNYKKIDGVKRIEMGRPKKKPEYDSEKIMEQLMNCIVDAYMSGEDGKSANSLRQISEQFSITLMKTRKILIMAGVYHTELSDQVISLKENGKSISEIIYKNGYLPHRMMSNYVEMCRTNRVGLSGKEEYN